MKKLLDKWSWQPEMLKLFLFIPTFIGVLGIIISIFFIGIQSLWFLGIIFSGIIFRLIYGYVGKRVKKLKTEFAEESGEIVEGLLYIGKIQSPGLVILRNNELAMIPIVGKRITIPLNEIVVLKEGHMMPGKYMIAKRAFILKPYQQKRIAFAVTKDIGMRWSKTITAR